MDSLEPIANETDLDLLFPAIGNALDNFLLPDDISFIIEPPERTGGDTLESLPTAQFSAAAPASPPSAHFTNIQSIDPPIDSSRHTDLGPPIELFTLGGRRRPTHILPRKQLLRWDFLLESLRGDNGTVRSEVAEAQRREFDWLEQLAEEKRETKRRQQRERDATKRSKLNCVVMRASAGDIEARKEKALTEEKQRLKNMRGSARRKRQREDEVALQAAPRRFVEPFNFSALLKSFLAAQNVFTGKVNGDFQRRLCQAAQSMHFFKNGVQQKLINFDISVVDAHSTGVVPEIHPSMELSSQHLTAVVEKYTHGNISALVRLLYLPIQAGTELHALDVFMKCSDPFVTIPAKQLFFRASTSKSLAKGHSSYNVNVFPICDGLNSQNRKSDASSTGPRNPAWKVPETVFKVAKYEVTLCSSDRLSEDSSPRKSIIFHGIDGMEVWEKLAELGMIGAASSRSMQSASSFSRFRFSAPSHTKPWSADLDVRQDGLSTYMLPTEKGFDFSNVERFKDMLMPKRTHYVYHGSRTISYPPMGSTRN